MDRAAAPAAPALTGDAAALPRRHRGSSLLAVGLLLAMGACESSGDRSEAAEPSVKKVILLMTAKGDGEGAIVDDVTRSLGELAAKVDGLELIAGADLGRRLGRSPAEAIATCGADIHCIGGLGIAVGAQEVVFGRAVGSSKGVKIQFLTVGTEDRRIDRKVQIAISSLTVLAPALRERFSAIFAFDLPPASIPPPSEAELAAKAGPAPLARCATARGETQVRRAATLAWEPLRAGMDLIAGDVVKTGRGATARLTYRSGAEVDVAPSSVVVIEKTDASGGEAVEEIAVRSGTIRGVLSSGQGRIRIRAPDGERTELAPAADSEALAFRVGINAGETMEVAVSGGEGTLTSAKGDRVTLATGSAQDVKWGSFTGKPIELPDFPRLQAPGVDATVRYAKGMSIDMKWDAIPAAAAYQVQIGADHSFEKLLVDEITPEPSWSYQPEAVGNLFWRVATRNAEGRQGEFGFSRRIYVIPTPVPDLLVSPAADALISLAGQYMGFVTFSWRAPDPPSTYLFVVARQKELLAGEPVLRISTTAQEVMTRQLEPGLYFWGVFVDRDGEQKPIFRAARAFELTP